MLRSGVPDFSSRLNLNVMSISVFLAIAVLLSAAANLLHWRGRSDERFLYDPESGWLRFVLRAWTVLSIVASLLFLLGLISLPAFLGFSFGLSVALELYCIVRRQRQRATA